jgi:hypothetical protein
VNNIGITVAISWGATMAAGSVVIVVIIIVMSFSIDAISASNVVEIFPYHVPFFVMPYYMLTPILPTAVAVVHTETTSFGKGFWHVGYLVLRHWSKIRMNSLVVLTELVLSSK